MRRARWKDTYEMRVSKTRRDMRRHIRQYSDATGGWLDFDLGETVAMCHPFFSNPNGPFAVLFFNEAQLGTEVIAHEAIHLTMAHERFVLKFGMDYGDDCNEDEERFAYYHGKAVAGIVSVLREHGHIE